MCALNEVTRFFFLKAGRATEAFWQRVKQRELVGVLGFIDLFGRIGWVKNESVHVCGFYFCFGVVVVVGDWQQGSSERARL